MKTKQVPAIIMLVAGFITCIISIVQHMEFGDFVKTLFIVLICFYILGGIVKIILDKNFAPEEKETQEEEDLLEDAEELENIDSDGEEEP